MHDLPPDAFDVLARRVRPDGWLDRALLAYPDAFGDALAPVLDQARQCVLRHGDERSRAVIEPDQSADARSRELARVRRILAGRPDRHECTTPALVRVDSGGVLIALSQPVPGAGSSLAVRIQIDSHAEVIHARATRVEAAVPGLAWRCDAPSWICGLHRVAIEVAPNPLGFSEAMRIAHGGAGRVLVTHDERVPDGPSPSWRTASVMPSGWSYLRADRTMGSDAPYFPNGAPFPATHARVPDDDLFALCATRSWAGSLRDSLWLRSRPDYRVLS